MLNRKTKIVCSLGPSSFSDDVVRDLILAGMNIARLNFSHGSHDEHKVSIERVRRLSREMSDDSGRHIAILLDTKGPEIRTGMTENENIPVIINKGDRVTVTVDGCLTSAADGQKPARMSISWKEASLNLRNGHHILVADGLLDLEVLDVTDSIINCRANNTAAIGSKKNVNLLGIHAKLPIMSEKDKQDIAFGVKMGVDFIAASFLSFPHEVVEIKKYLESLNSRIKVIAKIECGDGVKNIREIAQIADGVMVARGDLGVQLPTEQIPLVQKQIISVCRKAGKPVITATQMLDSMIVNPRPTRAELTDVANAIFDGTDAVMLSGETANGAYPVEAVKMMDKIARTIECSYEFRERMESIRSECFMEDHNPGENLGIIMSRSGVEACASVNAKAIVTPTLGGNTARLLSAFRPDKNVLAVTPNDNVLREMQLYWGVIPCYAPIADESESMIQNSIKVASKSGVAEIPDKIVLVAGLPLQSPNMVNTVRVIILGTILARSSSGGFSNPELSRVSGRIISARTPNDAREKIIKLNQKLKDSVHSEDILVCKALTQDYIPIIRFVKGIICEEISEITDADLRDINPNLVWLTHIRHTTVNLESGLTVTIDAKELLVYEGIV
ncbi:MAG: pyruvate kinase [Treponema sp.]|jgi:pyruvate kinase|nr:pyruvate kinase [Treponema sp.]